MAKGISIPIASDTRDFSKGVQNGIIDPLEDVADALDDVAKDGDKAGEKLEASMKEAQKATEKLGKEHKELGEVIEASVKKGSRAMKQESAEGTSAAKRDLKELGNEAKQNAAETFASFDGSATSFADGIQGTLGGVVSSLGPIGMVAGAAAAVGLGFIMAGAEKAGEETERLKGIANELGLEYLKTGTIGQASLDYVVAAVEELATATGDGTDTLRGLKKVADGAEGSLADLAQSGAMSEEKLRGLWRESAKVRDSLLDQAKATDVSTEAGKDAYWDLIDRANAQRNYTDEVGKSIGVSVTAAEAAKAAAEAGLPELQMKAALVATVDQAYDDAAGAIEGYKAAETPLFDVGAYLASMQAREQALIDYQTTLASTTLTPEAKSFIDSQGVDAAAAFLAGYQKATPAQQKELDRIWTAAAKENSGSYTTAIDTAFAVPLKPPVIGKPVVPAPDMSAVTNALSKTYEVKFRTTVVDRNGRRVD